MQQRGPYLPPNLRHVFVQRRVVGRVREERGGEQLTRAEWVRGAGLRDLEHAVGGEPFEQHDGMFQEGREGGEYVDDCAQVGEVPGVQVDGEGLPARSLCAGGPVHGCARVGVGPEEVDVCVHDADRLQCIERVRVLGGNATGALPVNHELDDGFRVHGRIEGEDGIVREFDRSVSRRQPLVCNRENGL